MGKKGKTVQTKNPVERKIKKVEKGYSKFILLPVLALTAIIFANSIDNEFINLDDNKYIIDNPYIKNFSWPGIKSIFSSEYFGLYIPFTTFSWAIEYRLFGLNPTPYHVTNLVLHLANTVLVFYFIKALSSHVKAALIVSLFFAIHPMHVESVAWASERKDVLYSLFFLAALICYVWYVKSKVKPDINSKPIVFNGFIFAPKRLYVLCLLFYLLSLLSKPTAITLPVVLFLIDYYCERKPVSYKTVLEKIPFLVLSVLFGLAIVFSSKHAQQIPPDYSGFDRFFLITYSFAFYIVKAFLPFQLSAFYSYPPGDGLPAIYYFSPAVILLIGVLVYKAGKYKKDLVFGLLFFVLTISLFLQVVLAGGAIVADRYTYIPYIGLFFVIGQFVEAKFADTGLRSVIISVLVVYTLWFSVYTFNRNKVWQNSITLFSDVIDKDARVPFAYNNRGSARAVLKDFNGAIADYTIAIKYGDKRAYKNRGASRAELNDHLGAVSDYDMSIELYLKNDAEVYNNRGRSKAALSNYQGALNDFNTAIELQPGNAEAYNNRGNVKALLQDVQGAVADYNKAISLKPDYPDAIANKNYFQHKLSGDK